MGPLLTSFTMNDISIVGKSKEGGRVFCAASRLLFFFVVTCYTAESCEVDNVLVAADLKYRQRMI